MPKSVIPHSITTIGDRRDILEVDIFGDPETVAKETGFGDFTIDSGGKFVHFPRDCSPGTRAAERWHGNIRVIVNCATAGHRGSAWLHRVEGAFATL
jgi:hypothetical protein